MFRQKGPPRDLNLAVEAGTLFAQKNGQQNLRHPKYEEGGQFQSAQHAPGCTHSGVREKLSPFFLHVISLKSSKSIGNRCIMRLTGVHKMQLDGNSRSQNHDKSIRPVTKMRSRAQFSRSQFPVEISGNIQNQSKTIGNMCISD